METKYKKTPPVGKMADIANFKLEEMLSELPSLEFRNIKIELFETNIEGMSYGMIDESDDEDEVSKVIMMPEGFVFYPPWDGRYDT